MAIFSTAATAQNKDDRYQPKPYVQLKHPEWVKNATIYELNVRQFSNEGNFKGVEKDLPRLKKMGVDIIWLMPINPIGKINRKGTLGSYYSVKDYTDVNPEFGNKEDFKHLVNAIHNAGMKVIIDWVANHSSWDNRMAKDHPEWYKKDQNGKFISTPWRDYDDIIEFDYSQQGLRKYMTNALKYWVSEFGIDGYRCDVADFVPLDFWENARQELESVKPIFMLAEAENRELHRNAFDATYAWSLWNVIHGIALGRTDINPLTGGYITEDITVFPKAAIRMNFTENHDKNSWEGTQYKNFSESLHAMMVLMSTMRGMPLVYNGQEAGLDRSLQFFEKDPITWKSNDNAAIYTKLFALKHKNQSLWNGNWGGDMLRLKNSDMNRVISFFREKNGDKTVTIINLSKDPSTVSVDVSSAAGNYKNLFDNTKSKLEKNLTISLKPWEYLVLHNSEL